MLALDMRGLDARGQGSATKIIIRRLVLWLGALILAGVAGVAVYQAHNLTVTVEAKPVDINIESGELKPLAWPDYGQAAIATRQYGVVATHGAKTPHPTASTAKVITMLAVLEKHPLELGEAGPKLTMTQADVDSHSWYVAHNGSNTPVYVGLQLTQYQAMQSVLLASSNNMADTLAKWAFGSVEDYHQYANSMLNQWGLEDTVVGGDASGLSPLTTSTAADLARIALRAMDEPVLAEIVSQSQAEIPGAGTINNTNRLLANSEIIGMKTGETVEAGGNFILVGAQGEGSQSQQVAVVVMGAPLAPIAMQASYQLFQTALTNFSYQQVVERGQPIARLSMPWRSDTVDIVATQSVGGWVWASRPPSISYLPPASLSVGNQRFDPDIVGSAIITFGDNDQGLVESVNGQLTDPVSPPSLVWRLGRVLSFGD